MFESPPAWKGDYIESEWSCCIDLCENAEEKGAFVEGGGGTG
jgi:hypothetical protein